MYCKLSSTNKWKLWSRPSYGNKVIFVIRIPSTFIRIDRPDWTLKTVQFLPLGSSTFSSKDRSVFALTKIFFWIEGSFTLSLFGPSSLVHDRPLSYISTVHFGLDPITPLLQPNSNINNPKSFIKFQRSPWSMSSKGWSVGSCRIRIWRRIGICQKADQLPSRSILGWIQRK